MEIIKYLGKRIVSLVIVLFGISLVAFFLGTASPGDPAEEVLRRNGVELPTEQQLEDMREELGFNRPWIERYLNWLENALHGNLGTSFFDRRDVGDEIARRLPMTLRLSFLAMAMTICMGIGTGIFMALNRNKITDKVLRGVSILLLSVPGFWLALFLILIFSEKLRLLPTSGYSGWQSLLMPAFVLSSSTIGVTARLTRGSLLKELGEQYILVANSKGMTDRKVIIKHALQNSLIPIITVLGNYFGGILGGSAIIESVFALPGLGSYVLSAIEGRDYFVVQGYVLFSGCIYVLVTLLIDLLYLFINPKIRQGAGL